MRIGVYNYFAESHIGRIFILQERKNIKKLTKKWGCCCKKAGVKRHDTIALGLLKKNKKKKKSKKKEECQIAVFTSRGAHVNYAIIALLYTHSIGNQLYNTMVVFKRRVSIYLARDIPAFVMYCVYGESRSSLLIESPDCMIYKNEKTF